MKHIFILLLLFQLKHFLCDYPLQGKYMLGKFLPYPKFIVPLTAHCFVHLSITYLICYYYRPDLAFYLAWLDFVCHFIMDRIKASPNLLGRFKPLTAEMYKFNYEGLQIQLKNKWDTTKTKTVLKHNTYFWWSLGLDQMVHHCTHYLIIYLLLYL